MDNESSGKLANSLRCHPPTPHATNHLRRATKNTPQPIWRQWVPPAAKTAGCHFIAGESIDRFGVRKFLSFCRSVPGKWCNEGNAMRATLSFLALLSLAPSIHAHGLV